MPKARQRKNHKKKVQARNKSIKAQQSAMQKFMNEALQKQIEEYKKVQEASGITESNETSEIVL